MVIRFETRNRLVCKTFQNYVIADIRSDERSQEVLQTRQQEDKGIYACEDHDGSGSRLSHPQHATSTARSYRSK